MKLQQVEVFVAVVEAGTISAAARELGAAQSAVSNHLHALEADLSTTLFTRTSRRAVLTRSGAAFLPEARRLLATVQDARAAVHEAERGLSGKLRIGVDAYAGAIEVPRLVASFTARHPRLRPTVQFSPGGPRELLRVVADGELDAAFLSWPFHTLPQIDLLHLAHGAFVLLLPHEHPLRASEPVDLADFSAQRWVDLPATSGIRQQTDAAFAQSGGRRPVEVEVPDLTTAADYVRAGLGVALVPDVLPPPPEVHEQPIRGPRPRWTVSLATMHPTARRPHRSALAAFIDHVREALPSAHQLAQCPTPSPDEQPGRATGAEDPSRAPSE